MVSSLPPGLVGSPEPLSPHPVNAKLNTSATPSIAVKTSLFFINAPFYSPKDFFAPLLCPAQPRRRIYPVGNAHHTEFPYWWILSPPIGICQDNSLIIE
jgi:hypothetical protein